MMNEYQDFNLRKNNERILKTQDTNEKVGFALSFDIAIAIIVLCLDKWIDVFNEAKPIYDQESALWLANLFEISYPYIILAVLGLLPAIYLGVNCFKNWIKRRATVTHLRSSEELVDLFDNEICVFAMIAQSYIDMANKCANEDSKKTFYYIQACFYINKAIGGLIKTESQIGTVFTNQEVELRVGNKVSIDRLVNLITMLKDAINEVAQLRIQKTDDIELTKRMNESRREALQSFNMLVNKCFGKTLPTVLQEY